MGWEKSVLAVCFAIVIFSLFSGFAVAQDAEGTISGSQPASRICVYEQAGGVSNCYDSEVVVYIENGQIYVYRSKSYDPSTNPRPYDIAEKIRNKETIGTTGITDFPKQEVVQSSAVKIVVYNNLQSEFYYAVVEPQLKEIKQAYGDAADIEYKYFVSGDFAFDEELVQAAECSRDQGKFDEFNQKTRFTIGQYQNTALLKNRAKEIGLDMLVFNDCFDNEKKKSISDAAKAMAWEVGGESVWVNDVEIAYIDGKNIKRAVEAVLGGTPYSQWNDYAQVDTTGWPEPPHKRFTDNIDAQVVRVLEHYGERADMMLHLKFLIDTTKTTISGPQGMFNEWGVLKDGPDLEDAIYVLIPASKVGDAARFYGVTIVPSDLNPLPPVPSPSPKPTLTPTLAPTTTPAPTPKPVPTETPVIAEDSKVTDNNTVSEKVSAQKIEVMLSFEGDGRKATISNKNGGISLESQGVSAEIDPKAGFSLDQSGIKLEGKIVKLLPDKALATASATVGPLETKELHLKSELYKPVYEIIAVKKAKILGFLSIEIPVKAVVNANDGTIESLTKPWWSWLAG